MDPSSAGTLTPEDEADIRDSLKRCTPETIEAAVTYRKTGEIAVLPTVIIGIIARFVEPDVRPKLAGDCDDLRVLEDLGIDSLTMVEVVMSVEETLNLTIENEELQNLRTIGDIKGYIQAKLGGGPEPEKVIHVSDIEISELLPQDHPFLFVENATVGKSATKGSYTISGKESFLEGHFKGNPVFPASIMLEALGQLAILHMVKADSDSIEKAVDTSKVYFISCDGVRCTKVCKPGDKLAMEVRAKRIKHPVATFEGSIQVSGEKAVFAEEISLSFDYAPDA